MTDSFVRNCHFIRVREEDGALFDQQPNGQFLARLDGYTILPNEDFQALLSGKSPPISPPDPSA